MEYLRELSGSLVSLHQLGIAHNDIKPSNFLYNQKTKKGILIDYGLCMTVTTQSYNFRRETLRQAPRIL